VEKAEEGMREPPESFDSSGLWRLEIRSDVMVRSERGGALGEQPRDRLHVPAFDRVAENRPPRRIADETR
jgi:hypothetical protein